LREGERVVQSQSLILASARACPLAHGLERVFSIGYIPFLPAKSLPTNSIDKNKIKK